MDDFEDMTTTEYFLKKFYKKTYIVRLKPFISKYETLQKVIENVIKFYRDPYSLCYPCTEDVAIYKGEHLIGAMCKGTLYIKALYIWHSCGFGMYDEENQALVSYVDENNISTVYRLVVEVIKEPNMSRNKLIAIKIKQFNKENSHDLFTNRLFNTISY